MSGNGSHLHTITGAGRRALAVVAVLLACCACASPSLSPPTRMPAPSWPVHPQPAADGDVTWPCEVPMPADWRAAVVAGMTDLLVGEHRNLKAVSPDGRHVYVEETEGGPDPADISNTRLVDESGTTRITVNQLGDPSHLQYADVSSDGEHVAFTTIGFSLGASRELYLWDARSGATTVLVHIPAADDTHSLLTGVVVSGGKVAWTQAGPDSSDVHLYDIATARDRVIHQGLAFGPVLLGSMLVWPEAASLRAATHLVAADLATGDPVEVPTPLRDVSGVVGVSAGGTMIAWTDPGYSTLTAWETSWPAPRKIVTAPDSDRVDSIVVAGPLLTWVGTNAYALDVRTGKCTRITPQYGDAAAAGGALAVTWIGPGAKSGTDLAEIYVLDTDTLSPLRAGG